MEKELIEEINQLKILNDIYLVENERLKLEYRILYDKFNDLNNNSNISFVRRCVRKFKNIVKRIIRRDKNGKIFRIN